MKLLVTGGAGFIGSNYIRYWLKKYPSHKIVNLDKLTYAGHLSSTRDFANNKNYRFIKGDICDKKLVCEITKNADYVVHFAAESHVDRSIDSPEIFLKTNILGTHNLLEAALVNKIKRFHHVSTDEVFGSLNLNTKDKFSESTPYDPKSPYSASKAASDHLARAYHETHGLDVTITNCSNNFGPYQDPEKMLPRFITNLILGEKLPVYGDGKNVRDWLHVNDHIKAIDLVLMKAKPGSTYLVGGNTKEIDNLGVVTKLLSKFGYGKDMMKFVPDRKGHDKRYSVDWKKINKDLGWNPEHDFDEWLTHTINWYKENEWWWKPLKESAEKIYQKTGQR